MKRLLEWLADNAVGIISLLIAGSGVVVSLANGIGEAAQGHEWQLAVLCAAVFAIGLVAGGYGHALINASNAEKAAAAEAERDEARKRADDYLWRAETAEIRVKVLERSLSENGVPLPVSDGHERLWKGWVEAGRGSSERLRPSQWPRLDDAPGEQPEATYRHGDRDGLAENTP